MRRGHPAVQQFGIERFGFRFFWPADSLPYTTLPPMSPPRTAPPTPKSTPASGESASARTAPVRGLSSVRGQPAVVEVLRGAIAAERLHHAYLFDGPEGVGKASCARALFAALNCQNPPAAGEACGACDSCSKLAHGTHPDWITPELALSGLADSVEKLVRRLLMPPSESNFQVVLLDPADQLSAPTAQVAANRLLKTLEEPRARTVFVLVATAASGLLSTLRSRCQRLRFVPLPDDVLVELLTTEHGVSTSEATRVVGLAQGSIGRALRYLSEPEALSRRSALAETLYQAAQSGRAGPICDAASEAGEDREEALEILDLLWLRLHGELRTGVELATTSGIGAGSPKLLRLTEKLRAVREAQQAIRRYTSAPLSLERLARHLVPPAVAAAEKATARGPRP